MNTANQPTTPTPTTPKPATPDHGGDKTPQGDREPAKDDHKR